MRKQRALVLGLIAGGVVAGLVVMMVHIISTGSAGTALTIGLVGLGPAFAAMALVMALGAVAPPPASAHSAVSVSGSAPQSSNES